MEDRRVKIYKIEADPETEKKDSLVSDILERVLNGGIVLDASIRSSDSSVELITDNPHIVIATAGEDHQED